MQYGSGDKELCYTKQYFGKARLLDYDDRKIVDYFPKTELYPAEL